MRGECGRVGVLLCCEMEQTFSAQLLDEFHVSLRRACVAVQRLFVQRPCPRGV